VKLSERLSWIFTAAMGLTSLAAIEWLIITAGSPGDIW
jgi:hypothetical protein